MENTTDNAGLTSTQIKELVEENRERYDLPVEGTAPSNIRRQILRLREMFLVGKNGNHYRVNEGSKLSDIFEEKIESYFLNSIIKRNKEYMKLADEEFFD